MPTYIAKGVYSMLIGSWITPSASSTLLMTPFALSKPIQAYTRSSSDVQKGSTTSSSSKLRVVGVARAMP
jgi:hypothetical protein